MKLRNIVLAAVAAVSTILPAQARIEAGTKPLLDVLHDHGFIVNIDNQDCDGSILGAYRTVGLKYREMLLCPNGSVDAIDHSTVRHEMTHVLQHCVNIQRGTDRNTPIIADIDELAALVNTHVSADTVTFIKSSYPREKWLVEFEANYIENVYTADQLVDLFYEFECQYLFR